MGNDSPSRRRREGREAFFYGGNPDSECPYKDYCRRSDWMDGWNESASDFQEEQRRNEREELRETLLADIQTVGELMDLIERIKGY